MKAPWHLWVVGILALLWNAGGAFDYVATQLSLDWYVSNMPPEMKGYIEAYPATLVAIWALAVWLPVIAALPLLLRRAGAVHVFFLALVLVLLAGAWNYLLADPPLTEVAGQGVFFFWIAVVILAALQWLYARAMRRRGVLT